MILFNSPLYHDHGLFDLCLILRRLSQVMDVSQVNLKFEFDIPIQIHLQNHIYFLPPIFKTLSTESLFLYIKSMVSSH
jgi:hypothetical protein